MDSLDKLLQHKSQFLDYMANKRKVCATWLRQTTIHINRFYGFLDKNGINTLSGINKEMLNKFQLHLYTEHLISPDTVRCHMVTLRSFFSYLYMNNFITNNPVLGVELLKSPIPYYSKQKHYYTWKELIAKYRKHHLRNNYSIGNLKQKLTSIELLIKFLKTQGIKTIYKLTPVQIEKFKDYLDAYYSNSANHIFMKVCRLRFVCQFIKFFYYKGYLDSNPCRDVNYPKYRKEIKGINIRPNKIKSKPETILEELAGKYLDYRNSLGYSSKSFRCSFRPFMEYLLKQGITNPDDVTKADILGYQNWLTQPVRGNNKYSGSTMQKFLSAARCFFRFLVKYDLAKNDPTIVIELPNDTRSIPKVLMAQNDAARLLEAPDTSTTIGMRDRAILEVFYSTGVRANELAHLNPEDIDSNEGLIRINNPKGGPRFQRVVAIGKSACYWVKRYIDTARTVLQRVSGPLRPSTSEASQNPYLFLSAKGNRIASNTLNEITRQYAARLGLRKHITSHSWRVTCATLLLKNGADIRYVQEQLGHHCISSTQCYTRLHPKDLKRIHHKFHPQEISFRRDHRKDKRPLLK